MAVSDSTLGLTRDELRRAIAYEAGFGRDSANWSTQETDTIDDAVRTGLRQCYWPQPLRSGAESHKWHFLKPTQSITIWADVAASSTTLTASYNATTGLSLLTANADSFYESMLGSLITILGVQFTIVSYISVRQVEVAGQITTSGQTFSIDSQDRFAFSPLFGGIEGDLWHDTGGRSIVPVYSGEQIRAKLKQDSSPTGIAREAGIISAGLALPGSTQRTQQRFYLVVYPLPSETQVLNFQMRILPEMLTANLPYVYGGAMHAETIIASCLAALEWRLYREKGIHHEKFMELLSGSVSADNRNMAAHSLGYNADRGIYDDGWRRRRFNYVTVNGVLPT